MQPLGSVGAIFPRNLGMTLPGVIEGSLFETWLTLFNAMSVFAPASQCLPNAAPCVMHMERTFDFTIEANALAAFMRFSPAQPHIFETHFTLSADPVNRHPKLIRGRLVSDIEN